jgi:hypothetical protein
MDAEFKDYIIKTIERNNHNWEDVPEKYKNDPEILQARKVAFIKSIKHGYRYFTNEEDDPEYPEPDFLIIPPEDLYYDPFIREEIKKFIVENVGRNKDSYNDFNCYIRTNLENDPDITNALKEFWIGYLEKKADSNTLFSEYSIPKIIREDPDIFNARKNGWANLILNRPYDWSLIPEEFQNHEDVINARKQRWIINLEKENSDIKDVPKELMDDPDVIEAYRQGLLRKLESIKK